MELIAFFVNQLYVITFSSNAMVGVHNIPYSHRHHSEIMDAVKCVCFSVFYLASSRGKIIYVIISLGPGHTSVLQYCIYVQSVKSAHLF